MIDENDEKKNREGEEEEDRDESIEEGAGEDSGEFDDSFGLPDVDYKPLEETGEEEEAGEEEEPAEEEQEQEPVAHTEQTVSDFEEELMQGEESGFQESEEREVDIEEEAKPVSTYVPPKQPSPWPKILLGLLVVVVIGGAVWYFGFYRRAQQAEKERQEQLAQQQEQERLAAEQRERERQEELARQQEEEAAAAEEAMPDPGTAQTISERDGRYYVVIASFFDGDLAADYANMLSTEGVSSMILSPPVRKGFYRVALSGHATWNDAQNEANNQKSQYGEAVWVLKY